MKTVAKMILGLATIWPLVYIGIFLYRVYSSLFRNSTSTDHFSTLLILHVSTMILLFVLYAIYAFLLFKNPRINKDMNIVWAVLLFIGNVIAMPLYWYLYVWRNSTQASGASLA